MTELIAITQRALQSQSWKMKAQGGAAMATIAKQQTGSLVAPHLGLVLSALLQALAGRTWAGKVSTYTTCIQYLVIQIIGTLLPFHYLHIVFNSEFFICASRRSC